MYDLNSKKNEEKENSQRRKMRKILLSTNSPEYIYIET